MKNLPSASIIGAEYDPLRDEGIAFSQKLASAGVETHILTAPGMIHGFASMFEAVPDAWPWLERAGALLKAASA